jgi:hypothetical protein
MNPNNYGLIEMGLSFGVGLLFCVWQLISLERAKKRTREKGGGRPPEQAP